MVFRGPTGTDEMAKLKKHYQENKVKKSKF
jgi:hypothetical protein